MELLAGMILFSAAGAWISARARAAGAALAFGVVGAVLFCATPLGARVPTLIGDFVEGTAVVGGQLIDGHPEDAGHHEDNGRGAAEGKSTRGRE